MTWTNLVDHLVGSVPEVLKFQGDNSLVKFKNYEKTGNVLCDNISGMTLVAIWVRTDSFEFIKEEDNG